MNGNMIRCFASSGWGQRRCAVAEGVSCVVDTPTHSVGSIGTGLVARALGGAGRACVPDLDFMSVGPTLALLVPGRFD
jgi:hypothetical protein